MTLSLPGSGDAWTVVRVTVTADIVRRAWDTDVVRKALADKARQIQSRAEQIAADENVEIDSEVVELVRPKGRPEARVKSPNISQEWGDRNSERRRILGRAAES